MESEEEGCRWKGEDEEEKEEGCDEGLTHQARELGRTPQTPVPDPHLGVPPGAIPEGVEAVEVEGRFPTPLDEEAVGQEWEKNCSPPHRLRIFLAYVRGVINLSLWAVLSLRRPVIVPGWVLGVELQAPGHGGYAMKFRLMPVRGRG